MLREGKLCVFDLNLLENDTIFNITSIVRAKLRRKDGSSGISLENNILWTQASGSYDIAVSSDSEGDFQSDYNDLVTSGGGQVAFWQDIARPTLAAWQHTALTDQNSLTQDPLS